MLPASIVIPTYQRRDSVRRALGALCRQSVPSTCYEVIVAVDGSTDGTVEMVETMSAPFDLIAVRQAHGGRAAACNRGIERARGDIVVLLDDDMEATDQFLAAHIGAHAGADRMGVVGAAPIAMQANDPPVRRYIAAKFNRHLQTLATPDHQFTLRDFYSGNFSIRRAVLKQIGGFDTAFSQYGNEDLELSLRLRAAGIRLTYCPGAVAYQHYTKSFRALAQDTIAKGQTSVLLANKHPAAVGQLKLATYALGSRRWRWLRSIMLTMSRLQPAVPSAFVAAVDALTRRVPGVTDPLFGFTLDYLYWLGVSRSLAHRSTGS